MVQVIFYEASGGQKPVEDFMVSLQAGERAKVFWEIELLERYGLALPEPYSKKIRGDRYGGLRELRIGFAGNASRIIYFAASGDTMVLLHGFLKKTARTPGRDLETARRRMIDYKQRCVS